ncbi:uncharacterized protein N7487_003425 [Penicillium crustosum]|uniref:uncharacterized protein n=1 Tax=Penicillium crustosum TaxID=36656 RepID=UPI002381FF7D|nr:uncharacterized protein N7487_003425 [Penicillium crustosum]KAJ5419875.1 hypothetical protein N7487_003425 [Penicillium crustosum]
MLPHSHPEQKRWESPGGWGARHMNDMAPFTLWDEQNHKFRYPSRQDWTWIRIAVLTAIAPLARVRAAIFLPAWTIFELEFGDGRSYEKQSLPGVVAGRTALYHHGYEPFSITMRSLTPPLPRFIGPSLRLALTPGCRIESGLGLSGAPAEFTNAATTCGIKIRNLAGEEMLTVANHDFLSSKEVYHPFVNGDLVGDIIDTRPELDIALVKLTPAASSSFTNSCYFQAEPPTRLLEMSQISQGSWSEVDGVSSGLFSMMNIGIQTMQPKRPAGHPEIEFSEWDTRSVDLLFGNVTMAISDGVCGAPIVDAESGGVSRFFHLSDGVFSYSAVLDDLVAEGWVVV